MIAIPSIIAQIGSSVSSKRKEPAKSGSAQGRSASPLAQQPGTGKTNASQLTALQAQIGIKPEFSKSELAFMKLFDITEIEYQKLKMLCRLKSEDDISVLIQKIRNSLNDAESVKNAKAAIKKYNDYRTYVDTIQFTYGPKTIALINKIISRAFKETIELLKDRPDLKTYLSILKKYNIFNPLEVIREDLDKMSIYEETVFGEATEGLKQLAVSNLNFQELQKYLSITERITSRINNMATETIRANRPELLPIRERELAAQEILEGRGQKLSLILGALTDKAKTLITDYQQALANLRAALRTKGKDNDRAAQRRLATLRKEIATEVKKEYENAYVFTPSDSEKQAFLALIKATAELEIIDKQIICYARLSDSMLTDWERRLIRYYKDKGFGKPDLEPAFYQTISLEQLLDIYGPQAQYILNSYKIALEEEFDLVTTKKELTGLGKSRALAIFYALQSVGFSEQELLTIQAAIAFQKLKTKTRKILTGTINEQIDKCLGRLKELKNIYLSDNYAKLNEAKKEKIIAEEVALYYILEGLTGSSIKANYFYKLQVEKIPFGSLLESEYWIAEATHEKHDDIRMRSRLVEFSKISSANKYNIDFFGIIQTHLSIRKLTGEPVDQDFIIDLLRNKPLFGIDGQYNLDSFKEDLVHCLNFYSLEFNSQQKPNFNTYKDKLKGWLKVFIGEIRNKIAQDPRYSGSVEMANKVGIIGLIYDLLLATKICTEDEMAIFYKDNPLIQARSDIKTRDFREGGVFRTVGYEGLPQEIREAVEMTPAGRTLKQHSSLNIYWVPYDKSNEKFGGYANYDKDTIVVLYQSEKGALRSNEWLAGVVIHELKHKIDIQEFRTYIENNPDHDLPFNKVPSLITERNAYIEILKYFESLPEKSAEIKRWIKGFRDIIIKANILLGLSEDDQDLLHPDPDQPYKEIDLWSSVLSINPADIALSSKDIKFLKGKLKALGYNVQERKWILESSVAISAGMKIDLSIIRQDRRNLLVDFLGKLLGRDDLISNGMIKSKCLDAIRALNTGLKKVKALEHLKDADKGTELTLKLLLYLLIRKKT